MTSADQQTVELSRFLAGVKPFDAIDPTALAAIAAAATIRSFAAGDLVIDAFTAAPTEIYVVLTGEVEAASDHAAIYADIDWTRTADP